MASIASHRTDIPSSNEILPGVALRYAWYGWLVMLVCPFLLFLYVAWTLMGDSGEARSRSFMDGWFLASVGYMVLIVPASFFIRSRLFSAYWKGACVPPRNYLKGMYTTWVALEIGGLLSLTGCLVSRALLPAMLPALAAFMMFVVLWPSGRAMIPHQRGASDDPEKYEEPR